MPTFPFPSRPLYEALLPDELDGGRQLHMMRRDFIYHSQLLGPITVPADYTTDFASIPGLGKAWLDDDDARILMPSIVHDWLYTRMGYIPGMRAYTRRDADLVLREAMLACGARRSMAAVVYWSVRLCGGSHWTS